MTRISPPTTTGLSNSMANQDTMPDIEWVSGLPVDSFRGLKPAAGGVEDFAAVVF
jgi:hypothetical protein